MHIPSEMLSGTVCPLTATIAAVGIGASIYMLSSGAREIPSPLKFSLTSAAVFAVQMLNYPIWDGISGHLIVGIFAAAILGVPAAVLSMSIVLLLQTLLFADGGILMLGANIVNMALIGTGIGGLARNILAKNGIGAKASIAIAAFVSVELAAFSLCIELYSSEKGNAEVFGTLLGIHGVLGIIEATATIMLLSLVQADEKESARSKRTIYALGGIVITALVLSPLASAFPDAFEWTMKNFSLLPDAPNFTGAPFADYSVTAISSEILSGLSAAIIGIACTTALTLAPAYYYPFAAGEPPNNISVKKTKIQK